MRNGRKKVCVCVLAGVCVCVSGAVMFPPGICDLLPVQVDLEELTAKRPGKANGLIQCLVWTTSSKFVSREVMKRSYLPTPM
jgi:hypothetical protein